MRALFLRLLPPLAAALVTVPARGFEASFWVWRRELVVTSPQQELLHRAGVQTLYWLVGSLREEGAHWIPESRLALPAPRPPDVRIVPVLRLVPGRGEALSPDSARELAARIRALRSTAGADFTEAQIDFDCPDRRLAEYAGFLKSCREALAPLRLSATALAGWSRAPAFAKLQASVDALFPMFYDLRADAPADARAGRVLPLLDPATVARQLESWKACRIPWHAGLPGFSRVTVFDQAGNSRGHLRQWNWDTLAFDPALRTVGQPAPGVTLLRAETAATIADTPIAAGETLACRWPEVEDLRAALAHAKQAGAAGVAIFRFPEGGASGGWSLAQWTSLLRDKPAATPAFRLVCSSSGLELTNLSDSDLPPRLAGPGGPLDRGWQLELDAAGVSAFREANPGDFAAVYGHAQPDSAEPVHVPVALAERLTYWFADLPAGASRHSGLLQLAPGVAASSLRWRIPGSPQNSSWQALP